MKKPAILCFLVFNTCFLLVVDSPAMLAGIACKMKST